MVAPVHRSSSMARFPVISAYASVSGRPAADLTMCVHHHTSVDSEYIR